MIRPVKRLTIQVGNEITEYETDTDYNVEAEIQGTVTDADGNEVFQIFVEVSNDDEEVISEETYITTEAYIEWDETFEPEDDEDDDDEDDDDGY